MLRRQTMPARNFRNHRTERNSLRNDAALLLTRPGSIQRLRSDDDGNLVVEFHRLQPSTQAASR